MVESTIKLCILLGLWPAVMIAWLFEQLWLTSDNVPEQVLRLIDWCETPGGFMS